MVASSLQPVLAERNKSMKSRVYVEKREGVLRVANTRVSLDSIVYAFRDGQTPESIAQSFPLVTLEQVYGAIAVYLANRAEIDDYLEREEADFEAFRQQTRQADPLFYEKLAKARRQRLAS